MAIKKHIPVHANVETVAKGNLDRGLDVQVSAGHIRAQLGDLTSDHAPGGFHRRRIPENATAPRLRELEGCAEKTGQQAEAQQPLVVVVHIVTKAGMPAGVLIGHALKVDR
jgi:hypothetical protein